MKKNDQKHIEKAEAQCAQTGERFTPQRRRVLEIIAKGEKPVTAYEILDAMGTGGGKPKPPTVYRALEFLAAQRFVHRIESLGAYVACHAHHCHEGVQFLICDSCRHVEETHLCHPPAALAAQAEAKGFRFKTWNAELHGTCKACR